MALLPEAAVVNGQSTPEYLTLRKCFTIVVESIKEQSGHICNALFEKGHIPKVVHEYVHTDGILLSQKADKLANALIDKIRLYPQVYHDFIDILKRERPWADNIIEQLEKQFQEERAASFVDSDSSEEESLIVSIPKSVLKTDSKLVCPLCSKRFNELKLLPCFHTFCKSPCLEELASQDPDSNTLTCPICRYEFMLPENGVNELQTVGHPNKRETAMEINQLCEHCDEKLTAIIFCQQCGRMCSKCNKKHDEWKPNLSHTVSTIGGFKTNADKPANTSTCKGHLLNNDLFCSNCSELICIDCTSDIHKGHTFQFVKHVFQEHKNELEHHLHQLRGRLDKVNQTLCDFDCRAEDIKRQREDIASKIENEIIQLNHFLNEHKSNLIHTLDFLTQHKLNELSAQKATVTAKKAQISGCLEYAEAGLETGSEGKVLTMKVPVLKRIEELSTEFVLGNIPKADIELMSDSQALSACRHIYELSTDSTPTAMYSYITGKSFAIIDSKKQPSAVVHLRNRKNEKCNSDRSLTVELIHTKSKEQVKCTISRENDQCVITYQPVRRGGHRLDVKVNGKHIQGSPYSIAVAPAMKTFREPVAVISDLKLSTGVAAGKLQKPHRVVTNSKGHIIVADFRECTISIFTTEGVLLRKFGGPGTVDVGQFRQPCGVAVDEEDNIYIVDNDNSRIQKFASDGIFLNAVGCQGRDNNQFYFPLGICFNKTDQYLYICDQNNHRIQVISTDFTSFKRHIGEKGSDNGQLVSPKYAAFDSFKNLYVTDYANNRVQVFTADGRYVRTISKKKDDKHLDEPYGIAIDSADIVYVSELSRNCVSMFTAEGKFIISFGETGERAGQFSRIRGLYIDDNDSLIVSEAGNSRIQIFADNQASYQ